MQKPAFILLVVICVSGAAISTAKDRPTESAAPPPPAFQAVIDCSKVSQDGERLQCYDQAVAVMAKARESKELVVVDREELRETKRGLFGLTLPKLKLFGGGVDELEQVESTIASVSTARDGFSVFVLKDGARWKQTDGRFQYPKAGQAITIRKGPLGSYLAKVDKQTAVKVIRIN